MFDALHADQQQRWRKGERVLVEWYAQRHPELARDPQALTEMIFNEIALRESLGERPTLEEYLLRFASCEETLRSRSAARASKPAGSVADEFATVVAGASSPSAKTIVGSNKPVISGGANQTKENINCDTIVDARTKAAMTPVSPAPAPKSFDTIADPRTKASSTPVSPSPVPKSFDTIVDPRTRAANTPVSPPSRPAPKSPDTIVDSRTKSASTPVSPPPPATKSTETIVDARTKSGSTPASPPPATKSSETDFSLAPQPPSPRRSQEFATVAAMPDQSIELDTFVEHIEGPKIPGFEILSELGRGGMGIVYKARQLSADRFVALKVVRNDVLDTMPLASRASTLERFQQEAQAAARLEHDNLVTVFEVGTANGMRYYAMRFVEGCSLYDMIRDKPLDNRRAAGYLEPVCRGLHYAHERGILHRDLKPHNILVDERLNRPLVADFGLAKFMERRDELTHAGELMGTPSYMPPEQAQNAANVTALADVYSLGATLYHILTHRPPFQAANVAETIRQIIDEEPVAPRQLNPAIDRDLETICLKCLQKEPTRRYGSAELLADDLRRYLNHEPILARPINWFGRTVRWCRRKPVQAVLIATAAMSLLFAMGAIIVGYRNTSAALAESESRLQKALQVVDELFTRVSEDELLNEPGMQPLRKDLLTRALKHYQYFLAESGGNTAIQDEVAAARFRIGLIMQATGESDKALEQFKAARELQERLLKQQPADSRRLKALADTFNALGGSYREAESLDDAMTMFSKAVELRTQLVSQEPANDEFQRLLANARMNLGQIEMGRGKNDKAREEMLAAQTMRRSLLDKNPKARRDLAMGYYNLGKLAMEDSQDADAVKNFRESIGQFEQLLEKDPRSLANRYLVAVCYRQLGTLQANAKDLSSALLNFEIARLGMEKLAVGNPDVVFYQTELANLTMILAELYDEQNDLPRAHQSWTQVLLSVQDLLRNDPRNTDYRRHEAAALGAIGNIQLRRGEGVAASQMLVAARDRLQHLLAEFPDDQNLKDQLTDTLSDLQTLATGPNSKESEKTSPRSQE